MDFILLAGRQLVDLPCGDRYNFIPELPQQNVDIIYLCFPNNPTGAVATKEQLKAFVNYANSHQAVIIFDAVYTLFITTPNISQSIYEIEGAKECAIEIGSFSKMANFRGIRGDTTTPRYRDRLSRQPLFSLRAIVGNH